MREYTGKSSPDPGAQKEASETGVAGAGWSRRRWDYRGNGWRWETMVEVLTSFLGLLQFFFLFFCSFPRASWLQPYLDSLQNFNAWILFLSIDPHPLRLLFPPLMQLKFHGQLSQTPPCPHACFTYLTLLYLFGKTTTWVKPNSLQLLHLHPRVECGWEKQHVTTLTIVPLSDDHKPQMGAMLLGNHTIIL